MCCLLFRFPGTFSGKKGLTNADNCTLCTEGSYCGTKGLDSPSGQCWGGHYCTQGALIPNPEKDRRAKDYPDYLNFVFDYLNDACPPGYYCNNGSRPVPCPPGYYHNTGRISTKSQCLACPIGKYCPNTTISGGVAPDCDAGYVCTGGSSMKKPDKPSMGYPCPAGYYCLAGTNAPLSCLPGSYQPNTGQSKCLSCSPGNMCPYQNMTTVVPCKAGYYCPDGTPAPCPKGTYGNNTGLSNITMCTDCPAGKYCSEAGSTKPKDVCAKGFYCQGAAISATPSPTSKYPRNGPCPKGHYCGAGTLSPQKCPPGTFRNSTGAESVDHCLDCEPGWYCGGYGNEKSTDLCAPGYYCPQSSRANVSTPTAYQCPVEHRCPKGSPNPIKCEPGMYKWSSNNIL